MKELIFILTSSLLLNSCLGQNEKRASSRRNQALATELDSIYNEDQNARLQLIEMQKKFDWESQEIKSQWKIIAEKDSLNLRRVASVLDTYGWLGPDVVGKQGNLTLFLVVQHADQATQEKYLPMMRAAAKSGNASSMNLALLEDRVALGQGKKQIFGSQIGMDPDTKRYYISPLEDPDNVDKRRAAVGLPPLNEYLKTWELKWDVEQYKKDLPWIEEKAKLAK